MRATINRYAGLYVTTLSWYHRMIQYKLIPKDDAGVTLQGNREIFFGASALNVNLGLNPAIVIRAKDGSYGCVINITKDGSDFSPYAEKAIEQAIAKFAVNKISGDSIETALIGGSDSAKWKATKLTGILRKTKLPTNEFDLNGMFYRKLYFDPKSGLAKVFREEVNTAHWNPGSASLSLNDGTRGFSEGHVGGVVTNATRFFRQQSTFKALREHIIPEHLQIAPGKPFYLWSAACSSGVEAYSYAMYIHRLLARARAGIPFMVFGTDINEKLVKTATKGEYDVAGKDLAEYSAYFKRYGTVNGSIVKFGDEIKKFVSFRRFDLKNKPRSRKFCMIVCANVFQYYQDDAREHFLGNFISAIERPGYIFANPLTPNLAKKVGLEVLSKYQIMRAL
ncbi:hypothetical protein MNBD_NITROSPINAE01-277 [hydrothermal vent metagenome]|uniref:CheR-type methyltransferase domain-containing protein n=1 Tax=hydrothermal vent metagenome TaxID=652676 RepID=A0A3B1CZ75_9ZZZZ